MLSIKEILLLVYGGYCGTAVMHVGSPQSEAIIQFENMKTEQKYTKTILGIIWEYHHLIKCVPQATLCKLL